MANQTITLKAQRVNVFGPAPTVKWGSPTKWGAPTNWAIKTAGAGGSPALLRTIGKGWTGAGNSTTILYQRTNEQETDGRGYNYVFVDGVTNYQSAAAAVSFTSITSYEGAGL